MATNKSRSKARSDGGTRAGKRRREKEGLRDLESKDGQKIRGGVWGIPSTSTSTSMSGSGSGKATFNEFTITK